MEKFFLTQIKKNLADVFEKGVVIKETLDDAKQSMHAYFGAYGYKHDNSINFVMCIIADARGNILHIEVDDRTAPTPEPVTEE